MYEVTSNQHKNRLYFTLKGFMSADEIKQATEESIRQMERLKPGFTVISNIAEFSVAGPEATSYISKMQGVAAQLGVRKVVRVVKSTISSMQFKRTQHLADANYETEDVYSVEEAERLLDAEA